MVCFPCVESYNFTGLPNSCPGPSVQHDTTTQIADKCKENNKPIHTLGKNKCSLFCCRVYLVIMVVCSPFDASCNYLLPWGVGQATATLNHIIMTKGKQTT